MSIFEYKELELATRKWRVAKVLPDPAEDLFQLAKQQARLKSKYTMPYSQAGIVRDAETKYQRQFMGCLAEIYAEQFLKECLQEWQFEEKYFIRRYDNVRTDGFKSPANEYDLQLVDAANATAYKIECRSSVAYDRSLQKALEQYDIIGPYSSSAKEAESYSHIYIRPLYEVVNAEQKNYNANHFEKLITDGAILFYIAGGCFRKDMIEKGYRKSMQQGNTYYRVVKLTEGYDAVNFKNELRSKIEWINEKKNEY